MQDKESLIWIRKILKKYFSTGASFRIFLQNVLRRLFKMEKKELFLFNIRSSTPETMKRKWIMLSQNIFFR